MAVANNWEVLIARGISDLFPKGYPQDPIGRESRFVWNSTTNWNRSMPVEKSTASDEIS